MVQQVHCSQRRLLRMGLEFHVCTINKSAHTKKFWKLFVCTSYMFVWTYISSDMREKSEHLEQTKLIIYLLILWRKLFFRTKLTWQGWKNLFPECSASQNDKAGIFCNRVSDFDMLLQEHLKTAWFFYQHDTESLEAK